MTGYNEYIEYFKKIAEEFFMHSEDEKHFFNKGLDEYLNGLTNNVNYPALLLDTYDFHYINNRSDDVNKSRTIAFIVCDVNSDMEDYERTNEIMDTCERLVDKIYNKIYADISDPHNQDFVRYMSINHVDATPVSNYGDQNYGFYVTIELISHHSTKN